MTDEWLKVSDLAEEFGVDGNTVRRWMRSKGLRAAFLTLGGHARFSRADVDRFKLANVARHLGQLPDRPRRRETVEQRIAAFLARIQIEHGSQAFTPPTNKRYDQDHRYRDAKAHRALDEATANDVANVREAAVRHLTGRSRQELAEEIQLSGAEAVAARTPLTTATLLAVCRDCGVAVAANSAGGWKSSRHCP
ncbi:excisionase family DNA binding protein [Rhodopseudomonas thermotolerans]|uniref:Excisionase family DNA binding protein n=2 Tax=Rhodopseudomonas TaxID=1073 RepID=A0A336JXL3_9BRAD|nr:MULTISPECIES: helix-turn-helix domain-containing protein [Rhodopseudomonas]RED36211.1 excisionase family DNA binding protein [Rhodopseudomonas pentothenatexigens]REG03584.1 excisionase family DNA binding protein [Rhodopseudomonas thermotolerans]SSW90771.1 excisionase family DNA binding protein [Rhodopseudomonas pentothenatexigens]